MASGTIFATCLKRQSETRIILTARPWHGAMAEMTMRRSCFALFVWLLGTWLSPTSADDDVATLVSRLKSQMKDERIDALRDLSSLGRPATAAIPNILPLLHDSDEDVRAEASSALVELGPGPDTIPALLAEVRADPNGWEALEVLIAVGRPAVPVLLELLHDEDAELRESAIYAFGEFGPAAPEAVPALIGLYSTEPLERRIAIANTLAEIGSGARQAIPVLIPALSSSSGAMRLAAAQALWRIEGRPERVVPVLMAVVEADPDGELTSPAASPFAERPAASAAKTIGRIGPEARRAVPALLMAVCREDIVVCNAAIEALEKIGPEAKEAIPELVRRLGDRRDAHGVMATHGWSFAGSWQICQSAGAALAGMELEAVSSLIPALGDPDEQVRILAVVVLTHLGSDALPALPALTTALQDSSNSVRRLSAEALGELGPAAESALPALRVAARDPSGHVRRAAVGALTHIERDSPALVATLIEALDDADVGVQATAIASLGRMGPAAEPAVEKLSQLLLSDKQCYSLGYPESLSERAASALGELGSVAGPAVPELIQVDRDSTGNLSWNTIAVLGQIGPAAKSAVPFLLEHASCAAALAILRIDPDNAEIMDILRDAWQWQDNLTVDPDDFVGGSWSYVLGRYGARVREALPALEKTLEAPHWFSRLNSAMTILEIEPTHERALRTCVAALEQGAQEFPESGRFTYGDFLDSDLAQRLDELFPRLGPHAVEFVPALRGLLRHPNHDAWLTAARRVAALGPLAQDAAPELIRLLAARMGRIDPDEEVRSAAETALAQIGPAAIPALVAALQNSDVLIRSGAANALGRIGSEPDRIVPALVTALGDERVAVRSAAASALKQFGPAAAPAVPALTCAVRDEYSLVRLCAAETLGAVGTAAANATCALQEASCDDFLAVREAAQAALRRIEKVSTSSRNLKWKRGAVPFARRMRQDR
jgi:HEAT repeat protein